MSPIGRCLSDGPVGARDVVCLSVTSKPANEQPSNPPTQQCSNPADQQIRLDPAFGTVEIGVGLINPGYHSSGSSSIISAR